MTYFRPLTFWDGPHSVCGVCVSLNKSTSYLSLCLSLNSFCNKTSRTRASLSPETRCVISIKRPRVQVPMWVVWFWFHQLYFCQQERYYMPGWEDALASKDDTLTLMEFEKSWGPYDWIGWAEPKKYSSRTVLLTIFIPRLVLPRKTWLPL